MIPFMQVLKSGSAQATVSGVGVVKEYVPGGFFGELALMAQGGKRAATITATSDVTCLVVPREEFMALLGPLDDALAEEREEYSKALARASSGQGSPTAPVSTRVPTTASVVAEDQDSVVTLTALDQNLAAAADNDDDDDADDGDLDALEQALLDLEA